MTTTPLISIVVPAYNSELWLEATLNSILAQTYSNIEVIVINDGSTDATAEVMQRVAHTDNRIITHTQTNQGQDAARNAGIALARGKYIGFVDSDDIIEPDMYARLVMNAMKYDAEISHCGLCFCWLDGSVSKHYGTSTLKLQDNYQGQIDLLEGKIVEPSLCNKLYKSSLFKNYQPKIEVKNNEDLLKNFYLFQKSRLSVFEDFCGYRYIKRENSMSSDRSRVQESVLDCLKARKRILEMASEEIKPFAWRLLLNTYISIYKNNYLHTSKVLFDRYLIDEVKREIFYNRKKITHLRPKQKLLGYIILLHSFIERILANRIFRIHDKKQ